MNIFLQTSKFFSKKNDLVVRPSTSRSNDSVVIFCSWNHISGMIMDISIELTDFNFLHSGLQKICTCFNLQPVLQGQIEANSFLGCPKIAPLRRLQFIHNCNTDQWSSNLEMIPVFLLSSKWGITWPFHLIFLNQQYVCVCVCVCVGVTDMCPLLAQINLNMIQPGVSCQNCIIFWIQQMYSARDQGFRATVWPWPST